MDQAQSYSENEPRGKNPHPWRGHQSATEWQILAMAT